MNEILVTPRLPRVLRYKKSTEKHATHQKVKLKSKKVKFAPHFPLRSSRSSLSKYGALGALGFGNYCEERNIKASGAALCEYELVAESFYFSLLLQNLGGPNSHLEIPPQRTEAAVEAIISAKHTRASK